MIPIFLQSWNRWEFTEKAIGAIRERTPREGIRLHVLDNGSSTAVVEKLWYAWMRGDIDSLHLEGRNTGCLYPKHVFHAMVPDDCEWYVISDNDLIPCVGWLPGLLAIMKRNPDLACLTLDYLPRWPLQPLEDRGEYVRCKAVGNTFKLCRRQAIEMVIHDIPQKLGAFGDDGILSELLWNAGWEVGYAKGLYCYNLELTMPNWGYTPEQLKEDPRKAGYQEPKRYTPLDWDTLAPSAEDIARMG